MEFVQYLLKTNTKILDITIYLTYISTDRGVGKVDPNHIANQFYMAIYFLFDIYHFYLVFAIYFFLLLLFHSTNLHKCFTFVNFY